MEITDEFVEYVINETIEFDKNMEDLIFLEKMKIEEEKMKNVDLRTVFDIKE